ncbi:hypothetical protein ACFL2R_03365 [Patescibacteria group bacterium]
MSEIVIQISIGSVWGLLLSLVLIFLGIISRPIFGKESLYFVVAILGVACEILNLIPGLDEKLDQAAGLTDIGKVSVVIVAFGIIFWKLVVNNREKRCNLLRFMK